MLHEVEILRITLNIDTDSYNSDMVEISLPVHTVSMKFANSQLI